MQTRALLAAYPSTAAIVMELIFFFQERGILALVKARRGGLHHTLLSYTEYYPVYNPCQIQSQAQSGKL